MNLRPLPQGHGSLRPTCSGQASAVSPRKPCRARGVGRPARLSLTTGPSEVPITRSTRAVEIDHGVAIVPQATVVQEVRQGTLVTVAFKGKEFTRPLAILHRKGRFLTPAMKKFIETLNVEIVTP